MKTSLMTGLAVLVALELGFFYVQYYDVVRLSGGRLTLVADERFPEAARAVLARPQISRRLLERVADVAQARSELDLQVRALERIVAASPRDSEARLRLAQALRDAGQLEAAERLYRAELELPVEGAAR